MSQPMPTGKFCWLDRADVEKFDPLRDVSDDSGIGYIVECTLQYPEEFHVDHNSLPLAAEKVHVTNDMLSAYAAEVLLNQKGRSAAAKYKAQKLSCTFNQREKYVCHGTCLKLYLELGMKLVKIHRVLSFEQSRFMKPYIDFCSQKRAESKTKSRGNVFKLCANSVFGKLILM